MNELALFSGIGGLSLGLHMADPNITTVCHVEIDRYAAGVLMSRMRDGSIPFAPIWDDVRTFDGRPWHGVVDIISGGFPCQDISIVGKRAGITRETRSGLWFEFARLIDEIRPRYAFLENVPAIIHNGLGIVLGSLAEVGYDAEWCCIEAAAVGASHKRERWFCLAYDTAGDNGIGGAQCKVQGQEQVANSGGVHSDSSRGRTAEEPPLAHAANNGEPRSRRTRSRGQRFENRGQWAVEPDVGRVAHGVPNRVDKLRCLGNAVVPQQVALAWKILTATA